jgi:hypothetical protein
VLVQAYCVVVLEALERTMLGSQAAARCARRSTQLCSAMFDHHDLLFVTCSRNTTKSPSLIIPSVFRWPPPLPSLTALPWYPVCRRHATPTAMPDRAVLLVEQLFRVDPGYHPLPFSSPHFRTPSHEAGLPMSEIYEPCTLSIYRGRRFRSRLQPRGPRFLPGKDAHCRELHQAD